MPVEAIAVEAAAFQDQALLKMSGMMAESLWNSFRSSTVDLWEFSEAGWEMFGIGALSLDA